MRSSTHPSFTMGSFDECLGPDVTQTFGASSAASDCDLMRPEEAFLPADESAFLTDIIHVWHSGGFLFPLLFLCQIYEASTRQCIHHHKVLSVLTAVTKIMLIFFPSHTCLMINCTLCFADERDRVQKKTFTKWVNKHLIKVRTRPWLFLFLILNPDGTLKLSHAYGAIYTLPRGTQKFHFLLW